jgi:hypothetical protein
MGFEAGHGQTHDPAAKGVFVLFCHFNLLFLFSISFFL